MITTFSEEQLMADFGPSSSGNVADAAPAGGAIRSPASVVSILALSVFIIEFGLMVAFSALRHMSPWESALLDGTMLTVLLAPILYFFLFRPLCANIVALQRAQKELQDRGEHLEQQVRARTAELTASNAALHASFREIDDLYQNAPFGYHSIDRDGVVVKMNDTELSWLGYTRDEIIGKKRMVELLAPKSAARFRAQAAQLREQGFLKDIEAKFVRKDGSLFPVLVNAIALRDEHGEFLRSRASVYDNTARNKAERERAQYFRFFNASSDLMAIGDKQGVLKKVNPAFVLTLGFYEAELLGKPYTSLVYPDDLERTLQEFGRLVQQGLIRDYECRSPCRDGSLRWISWSAIVDQDEGQIYVTGRDITEQKHYQESLYSSNQFLERVFNTTHFCAAHLDRDFNFIRVNEAYAAANRHTAEYFPGKNHFQIYPSAEVEGIFRNVVQNGEVFTVQAKPFEFPEHPEWGVSYWDWTVYPLKSPDGQVESLLFVLLDVTGQQRAKEEAARFTENLEQQVAQRTAELRAKEELLQETLSLNQSILTASEVGIAAYRADGQCIWVNPAFSEIIAGSEAQLLAQNFHHLASWQQSGLLGWAENVLSTGEREEHEVHVTTTFGREIWLQCQLARFSARGEPHLLVLFHDITDRKRAERTLRDSRQQLQLFIEWAPVGIAMLDKEMRYLAASKRFFHQYDFVDPQFIGRSHYEVFPEIPERWRAIHRAGLAGETLRCDEDRFERADGSVHWIRWEIRPWFTVSGEVGGIIMFSEDIAQRKKADEELKAAKTEAERANNSKSRFLAAASHDLRQPLSALKLYIGVLKDKLDAQDQPLVRSMQECVGGLSSLLSKLLDLSKLDAGVVKPQVRSFALDEMLHKVVAAHAPEAEAKGLSVRCGDSGLTARTDPVLFQRVIGNFVANAIRYSERGGALIGVRRHAGRLWVEVWDTGIGIPQDKLGEIFEEFKQLGDDARTQGSGLGLAIVKKTAELLGLQIRVQSRPGKGSMFAIELPLGKRVQPHAQQKPGAPRQAARIAVVDDNPVVLHALVCGLESAGHEVVAAPSGAELLSRLGRRAPEIMVCDYRLGGGETGFDVISAARSAFGAELPAIIITGDTDPKLMRRMGKEGVVILHKPVELEDLEERIEEAMRRPSAVE
jgi:PAS domain S-box-containing protein